jgi:hypothetical protein
VHVRPQILLVMRQTDAAHTQALASKVSLATLGQQAILDAHLCLVHLTTGAATLNVYDEDEKKMEGSGRNLQGK